MNPDIEFVTNLIQEMHKKDLPAYSVFSGEEGAKEALAVIHDRLKEYVVREFPSLHQELPLPINKPIFVIQEPDDVYFVIKKDDGLLYDYGLSGISEFALDSVSEEYLTAWMTPPEIFLNK